MPITSPQLLPKHIRSEGPLLHRHCPASLLLWPSPTPDGDRQPCCWTSASLTGLPQLPRSPSQHAVLTTPVDPTGTGRWFPVGAAFPVSQAGRHPRLHFRGLLKLHSRYGLLACSSPYGTLSRGFDPNSCPFQPLVSYHVYRHLHGWVPPPLVICAVGAH